MIHQLLDGSCAYGPVISLPGCTDPTAINYDPLANTYDGSCIPTVFGCTGGSANANQAWWDDTSVIYTGSFGLPPTYTSYALYTGIAIYPGTSAGATNYYAGATGDDGSCDY